MLRRTVTQRHPWYPSPVFFRTVLGLWRFRVTAMLDAGTPSTPDQYSSARPMSADSWIITRKTSRSGADADEP